MTIDGDADIRRREAADWFARLNQRRVTAEDVRQFSHWRRDPANAKAFTRLEEMWKAAGTLAGNPEMAKLAETTAASSKPRVRLSRGLVPVGAAGAAALALGVGTWAWLALQPPTYEAAVGEQRILQLEDGSRVVLDTGSRVSVRLGDDRRVVTLAAGRAMFDVRSDPDRPFTVRAGDTEITALGTRFDVRRSGAGARVILVDGRVTVQQGGGRDAQWALEPGEQVVTSTARPQVAPADVPAATSWTAGRLTFENTPIAAAVAEVNRYSHRKIELRHARISSVRVSGVFNTGDVDGFVAALGDLYPLDVNETDDGRILLSDRT
jgi:transmembrane sensor